MSYKNLDVWQFSRKMVSVIYRVTDSFPKSEMFGLVSQMRRAAVSIPCNIAEGYGRRSSASYAHFLRIAKGSVNELETLLLLSSDLGFVDDPGTIPADLAKIGSMLTNLISKVGQVNATSTETVEMFRPVGPAEYALLESNNFAAWPPRLSEQPIFYPVTNERYAREITMQWNVKDFAMGYVTRFRVLSAFADLYPVQCVGAAHHLEWWIPAEDLEALNQHMVGPIEVIGKYE